MKQKRDLFACGLWVAAAAFMAFGTIDSVREHHNEPLLAWGVFLGVAAAVLTGWTITERVCAHTDDTTITRVIEVVDALHQERNGVSQLH